MKKPRPNRYRNSRGGSTYAAAAIVALVLLVTAGYFFFSPGKRREQQSPPTPPPLRKILPPRPVGPQPQLSPATPPAGHGTQVEGEGEKLPPRKPSPALPGHGAGRLAIIIDDMGSSMQEARSLSDIGVPLTFAIIPGLPRYREVAGYAAANGVEIMIHVPMQSKEWPRRRLEANGLLVAMSPGEIKARMEGFVSDVPGARGANNHMGSEFTEHEAKMRAVIEVLREKGIFFIDSVTSPGSVGATLSREMGVATARRNVFLDNEQNGDYIRGQLAQAVRLARKSGAAIAICHPHPATIRTLASVLPGLAEEGITLVPASSLVR